MTVTIDKARGCLLGQAIGDALGAPIEGWSRERVLRTYGPVRDYVEAAGSGVRHARLPGLYTDDTQQALILADVLAEYRGFDPEGARRLYVELARPSPGLPRGAHRGTGGNYRTALERMAAAPAGEVTGIASAGNGAAMRIAPLGLWYAGDRAALQQAVIEASRQTHTDARAIAAAAAVAYLVAHLAAPPAATAGDARAALRAAAAFAQETEAELCGPGQEPRPPRFSAALLILDPLWEAPRWDVLRTIVVEANRQQPAHPIQSPSDSFACASVPTAIYLALHEPSFEEAIVEAINLGGDADTVGAIAGALAGARWGAGAIPQRWLDGLANLEGIVARADALAGGTKGAGEWQDLPAIERRLTLAQQRLREGW